MTRILTVSPADARGVRRLMFAWAKRSYGGVVPGIFQVLAPDLRMASAAGRIYNRLHLRKHSPLNRLQREMVAVVVNGLIAGRC